MSKMILRGHRGAEFKLNVTQFRSPMTASINTVQTRKMTHHFPIRAGQPDIQFTVHFRSIDDHHAFRDFVRDHQRNAQIADHSMIRQDDSGMVTLFWPERGIVNWKGYITSMPGREVRFEYAPKITFGVTLVSSMLTERTYNSSSGSSIMSIIGQEIGPYIGLLWNDDIRLPTTPSSQQGEQETSDDQQQASTVGESVIDWVRGIYR